MTINFFILHSDNFYMYIFMDRKHINHLSLNITDRKTKMLFRKFSPRIQKRPSETPKIVTITAESEKISKEDTSESGDSQDSVSPLQPEDIQASRPSILRSNQQNLQNRRVTSQTTKNR